MHFEHKLIQFLQVDLASAQLNYINRETARLLKVRFWLVYSITLPYVFEDCIKRQQLISFCSSLPV
jgi:hypothetical protein